MIKVTFEASSTAALYKAMADFLEPAVTITAKPAEQKAPAAPKPAKTAPKTKENPPKPDISAAPAAVKLAAKHGIDLALVPASGKSGNVLKSDVEAYMQRWRVSLVEGTKTPPSDKTRAIPPEPRGESTEPTIEDARDALKKYGDSHTIPQCMELLARYGVKRVSDLLPDAIERFIGECEGAGE